MTKEEQIARVAVLINELGDWWGLSNFEIAEHLVLHPETPVRTAEGFEIVEPLETGLLPIIEPVNYSEE